MCAAGCTKVLAFSSAWTVAASERAPPGVCLVLGFGRMLRVSHLGVLRMHAAAIAKTERAASILPTADLPQHSYTSRVFLGVYYILKGFGSKILVESFSDKKGA